MLAVLGALVANGLITVLKFFAAVSTDSSGMMAEALHSLTDLHTGPGGGAYWDGLASIVIGVVLGIVAFVLARFSRGLLLGEAANPPERERICQAILAHPHVVGVVELLTMHLAPKQILINARVNFRDGRATDDIEQTIHEARIKEAEPMVDMIFLETARQSEPGPDAPIPQHIG